MTSLIIHGEVNVEFINEFKTDEPEPPNPIVFPVMEPLPSVTQEPLPLSQPIQEVTADERRAAIRESWLKRFVNT
jgi:hypothetical protein